MSDEVVEESATNLSALKENLQRKGKNAYYYAHSHGADGPEWDGKEEPRLLSVSETTKPPEDQIRKKVATPIDSYGWSDGKKTVKILVDFENAIDLPDEHISLITTEVSVDFRITKDGKDYGLTISPLNESIESASFRKKDSRVDIILKKKDAITWHELRKKS
mmetsp:Transcript_17252/g.28846  ORF Transcript_17252/g.28846 Transcript_17252/m.28846 type:complete len:163 (-) Transcript_17252:224-712(-)|eukprot:CAMPEP_0114432826 /NCGR_PEP_ID=MMETSP0103-20121206/11365_1 /TAXON_ID=37642 ORGANISM="Paraphysomonas imperforata, Strain PA2" /NCGR_SAMPLE_ID=MMETSP0103 /ASSEMBLY_ACC=CAM_ASM_000201 /LENGTH=162 /DNA_ID=CAMNT_0001602533 /DNA_START=66 /DNA_END=554 /DNA_ORIENTATION=+